MQCKVCLRKAHFPVGSISNLKFPAVVLSAEFRILLMRFHSLTGFFEHFFSPFQRPNYLLFLLNFLKRKVLPNLFLVLYWFYIGVNKHLFFLRYIFLLVSGRNTYLSFQRQRYSCLIQSEGVLFRRRTYQMLGSVATVIFSLTLYPALRNQLFQAYQNQDKATLNMFLEHPCDGVHF